MMHLPERMKRSPQEGKIHIIFGVGQDGITVLRDLEKMVRDWFDPQDYFSEGKRRGAIRFVEVDEQIDWYSLEYRLNYECYPAYENRSLRADDMVLHFISGCRNETEYENLMQTAELAASALHDYGTPMTQGMAYLLLPNEKDRTLIERLSGIADPFRNHNKLFKAVHLVGGDIVHVSNQVKFGICSQLTAEYIFHCLESMDACYPWGGTVIPDSSIFYSLNGRAAAYCCEEISNMFLNIALKRVEGMKNQTGTKAEADQELRSMFEIPDEEMPSNEIFAHYFYERLLEIEEPEMQPEDEQRMMIHGLDFEPLYTYYKIFVGEEKNALSKRAEKIRTEFIRSVWNRKGFETLQEAAKDIQRGPYYTDSMVSGFEGHMTAFLSQNMSYANQRYKDESKKKYEKINQYREKLDEYHGAFLLRRMGMKRELVELLKECAEHEMEEWRYTCVEWLLRDCIKEMINGMASETRRWKEALNALFRAGNIASDFYCRPLEDGTAAIALLRGAAEQLNIQPIMETFLNDIVMNHSAQSFTSVNDITDGLLEECPYEEIMSAFEENRGEGFLIDPAARNRQLKVGEYSSAEEAFDAHYPY